MLCERRNNIRNLLPSYKCHFKKKDLQREKYKEKNDETTKVFCHAPMNQTKKIKLMNSQTPLPCHPSPLYPATLPPKEKKGGHWGACWLASLAARNF
jgi:hypothetical protein